MTETPAQPKAHPLKALLRPLYRPLLALLRRQSTGSRVISAPAGTDLGTGAAPKALAHDVLGRFREIVSDPVNLLIERHRHAGQVIDGRVILHNGLSVPARGRQAYYGPFSEILIINRGVHEPVEEYAFQCVLDSLPEAPVMLELGAYWGHYSMWLKARRPGATAYLVEPEQAHIDAGRANFAHNGFEGTFIKDLVGPGHFKVDAFLAEQGIERLDILHADIQGSEVDMLADARQALAGQRVDWCFVSTHSDALHKGVQEALSGHGYRIDISADVETETTSFDGIVIAARPGMPPLFDGFRPVGRTDLAGASAQDVVTALKRDRANL